MASAPRSAPRGLVWLAVALLWAGGGAALAQSALLDSVKNNPAKGRALCAQLKQLYDEGLSSTSSEVVSKVAKEQNLSLVDAEVLNTYVVGMYCPDVR